MEFRFSLLSLESLDCRRIELRKITLSVWINSWENILCTKESDADALSENAMRKGREQINERFMWMWRCEWVWVYGKQSQGTWSLCILLVYSRVENVSVSLLSSTHLPCSVCLCVCVSVCLCVCWDVCVAMSQWIRKVGRESYDGRVLCLFASFASFCADSIASWHFFPTGFVIRMWRERKCQLQDQVSFSLPLFPSLPNWLELYRLFFFLRCCSLSSWTQVNPLHLLNLPWITRISSSLSLSFLPASSPPSLWLFFQSAV